LDISRPAEFRGKSRESEKAFVLVIDKELLKKTVSGRRDILKK
jgi:hypothetical protein